MRPYALVLPFASLLIGFAPLQAQTEITIKLKERGEGETVAVKRSGTVTSKTKIEDAKGQIVLDQNEATSDSAEFTETLLKRLAGKPPTKLERHYGKTSIVKNGKPEAGPLSGQAVVIEKVKEKYVFKYANGDDVTGPAAQALAEDFDAEADALDELDKMLFPKQAVKVGASWKPDMDRIVKEYNKNAPTQLDPAKASGTGTLVKVYEKDGKQFGELKFKLEMPLLTAGAGQDQVKFTSGAKVVIDAVYDCCIDGTSEKATLKMTKTTMGNGTLARLPGSMVTVHIIDQTVDSSEEQAKK